MTGTYSIGLVVLSFLISVLASYTALVLSVRVPLTLKRTRLLWLLGGTIAMGTGIWATHFVAMLAFHLPIPINYDFPTTLLSLLYAIGASGIALWLWNCASSNLLIMLCGGACMGLAIAWMHYTGMSAMRLQAHIAYDLRLVCLSIGIAIIASLVALLLAFRLQSRHSNPPFWLKFGSAVVMGIAICGMHYTGMWATHFVYQTALPIEPSYTINRSLLAIAVSLTALFILSLILLISVFDQRLALQLVQQQVLQRNEEHFRSLIRDLQVGVLLVDTDARILVSNQAAMDLVCPGQALTSELTFGTGQLWLHEDGTPFRSDELPVQQVIAFRQPVRDVVMGIDCSDSQTRRWLLVNADPQLTDDGQFERIVCTFSDISKQKQAEEELRQSKEQFFKAFHSIRLLAASQLFQKADFSMPT